VQIPGTSAEAQEILSTIAQLHLLLVPLFAISMYCMYWSHTLDQAAAAETKPKKR